MNRISNLIDKITSYLSRNFGELATTLLIGAVIFLFLYILKKALASKFKSLARKTITEVDDIFASIIEKTNFILILLLSMKIVTSFTSALDKFDGIVTKILMIAVIVQLGLWGNVVSHALIKGYVRRHSDQAGLVSAQGLMIFSAKFLIWVIVSLLLIDNLGFDITALITGLGIGGVAVALAVQKILGDLLASLSIILDSPFKVGDFIIVGDIHGTVEQIGIKTTRIRSLTGEQLVVSNSDLLDSRIRNFKRMNERRVVFMLGVTYQTSYEKLKKIPEIIKSIIASQNLVRLDRVHFKEYGNFSLNFEVVYFVLHADFQVHAEIQQAINLAIFKAFEEDGIEFAYPTQTLFVELPAQAKSSEASMVS